MSSRTTGLTLSLIAAAAAATVPASAQKPPKPKPGPVTIAATPNPSVFSTPVAVTGRVQQAPEGTVVTLSRRILPSGSFVTLATAKTAKNGTYTFSQRPQRNMYYRVSAALTPPVQSPDLLVNVAMLVGLRLSDSTPAAGARVRFSGIVRPRHDGRAAYIQKQNAAGTWVTVTKTTLSKLDSQSSRYSKTIRVRANANYRVRVLGHDDHAMGISRTRTAVVH
jgi:hypothetical protein